ncbi:MAG: DUF3891 family protein [Pirellulales bacterium]|nr:DUF3891 family protein [Pirellulales bacterium]
MIRREVPDAEDGPSWLLLSQVDHAALAADLAESWLGGGVQPLAPRDAVLYAVDHHDDGWIEWEQQPQVDPDSGKPVDFLEMPEAQYLEIWSRSVELAAQHGPLPAWLVAGHFSLLAEMGATQRSEATLSTAWRSELESRRHAWLDEWVRAETGATPAIAARGLAQLRMFDFLSLWFCCAPRHEPLSFPTPDGPVIEWNPLAAGLVTVSPWPFDVPEIDLAISGRQVPQRHYRDAADLARADSRRQWLSWELRPA